MGHATTHLGAALAAAIGHQARVLRRHLPRAIAGDPRAVHRARVASRRLREALGIAAAADPEAGAPHLLRDVRRVTRALGPVREIDVASDELARAAARHELPPAQIAALRIALADVRDRRAASFDADMVDALDARAIARFGRALPEVPDARWVAALASRVRRRAARVAASAAACGTLYAPDRLHALRIAVKKLRYALELVPPAVDTGLAPLVDVLRAAQQRLGHLHDLEVLAREVRAIDARSARGRASLAPVLEALERDEREAHAAALALTPAAADAAREAVRRVALWRQHRARTVARASLDTTGVRAPRAAGSRRAARARS